LKRGVLEATVWSKLRYGPSHPLVSLLIQRAEDVVSTSIFVKLKRMGFSQQAIWRAVARWEDAPEANQPTFNTLLQFLIEKQKQIDSELQVAQGGQSSSIEHNGLTQRDEQWRSIVHEMKRECHEKENNLQAALLSQAELEMTVHALQAKNRTAETTNRALSQDLQNVKTERDQLSEGYQQVCKALEQQGRHLKVCKVVTNCCRAELGHFRGHGLGNLTPHQLVGLQQELTKAIDRVGDAISGLNQCVVCLDNQRQVMLMPCTHMCLCHCCAARVEQSCPLCRTHIESKVHVHL
jgi:hypothetical protein